MRISNIARKGLALLIAACAFGLSVNAYAADKKGDFTLRILHVNDTHSKFEPSQVKLTMEVTPGQPKLPVYVELGGYSRLASAVTAERKAAKAGPTLLLLGGDLVQGTLYYTKYEGEADIAFWNLLKPDASAIGNHEFDKGTAHLASKLIGMAPFPYIAANVDAKADAALAKRKVQPWIIRQFGAEKVGIVGLTTPETVAISSPGKDVAFLNAATSAQKAIDELAAKGINKIVIVSHLGYAEDVTLATALKGADVIVGGHSHTPLGSFADLGLSTAGDYPTVAKGADGSDTLIVQSWEWGKFLGELDVTFDASGAVIAKTGRPKAVVGKTWMRIYDLADKSGAKKRVQFAQSGKTVAIAEYDGKAYSINVADDPAKTDDQYDAYLAARDAALAKLASSSEAILVDDDPAAAKLVAGYSGAVTELKAKIIGETAADLNRGFNAGPGPLIADAMLAKTGAEVAITNPGGVRVNIPQGPISVATVYELLPFGNTLVVLNLTGEKLIAAIEDGIDFSLKTYGADLKTNPIAYVAGIKFDLDQAAERGKRVLNARLLRADGTEEAIDPARDYRVVVNNFIAAGGDRYDTLKAAAGKIDTGFNDAEAFMEYVSAKTLTEAAPRIVVK